ncbi:3-ketoacyl-ACP synthase I [Oleiphilus messinensis]|uniref:3-oxoacyl-[acyl-carrier-protein] synthase 1 n=1 Tax=Oleiphilus messinensis TaxID=141451 RepID=A0A1Y0IAZ6_9GAMM|nr:beta-ketoacyl synthase N-terminal-like domain-containing protein [Oleiphilus messinensis]ARU56645.1 3-ketoacyl-ACP synthase I [Oleiphilus messinensis]
MIFTQAIPPKRVVVTGMGIISSLGNDLSTVRDALETGKSGISIDPGHVENGLRSQVSGQIHVDIDGLINRKVKRFMGDASAYSYLAALQAIEQSGLTPELISNERTGLIMGAGGASTENVIDSAEILKTKGVKKVGPYRVTRTMSSAINANLATQFKILGINYAVTSACATSAHCIGLAAQQIQLGQQDVILAGGGDDCHWTLSLLFDAMGALSTKYNHLPELASRAYDADRDGFVISGGAGVVVLESLEHALERGAPVIAEITGFGATSDGADMVAPSGEGAARCMAQAIQTARNPVDYINAHGTSTPVGDIAELSAIRSVFKDGSIPPISSTKSLSGHALGAAGVHEVIYSLLMMQNDFMAASANIENLDDAADQMPILMKTRKAQDINCVMTNSFGFGGTNATLILERY